MVQYQYKAFGKKGRMIEENKNDPYMKVIPRQIRTEQKIGIAYVSWCSCWKSQECQHPGTPKKHWYGSAALLVLQYLLLKAITVPGKWDVSNAPLQVPPKTQGCSLEGCHQVCANTSVQIKESKCSNADTSHR